MRTVGAFVAALILAGCDGKRAATSEEARPEPFGKPDVTMDATRWHAEFVKDIWAAAEKYKGKVIELSGTVESVSDDLNDPVGNVYLKVQGREIGVRCVTTDPKPWLKVSPGSNVTVHGKAGGLFGGLHSAEIVAAGPNPGVVISARELTKEYATDRPAATKKYDDRWAYVDGVVIAKESPEQHHVVLKLKGEADIIVACSCWDLKKLQPLGAVVPGSKVKVFGKLSLYDNPKLKEIDLEKCILTEAE